jgi:hypothetical protein
VSLVRTSALGLALALGCTPRAQPPSDPPVVAEEETRDAVAEVSEPSSEVWSGCQAERPQGDTEGVLDVRALDWCETVIVPQFAVLHDGVAEAHDHYEGGHHALYQVTLVDVAFGRVAGVDEEAAVLLVHEDEHRDASGWSLGARLFVHVVREGVDVRVASGPAHRGERHESLRIEEGVVVVVGERDGQACVQRLRVEGDRLVGDETVCGS